MGRESSKFSVNVELAELGRLARSVAAPDGMVTSTWPFADTGVMVNVYVLPDCSCGGVVTDTEPESGDVMVTSLVASVNPVTGSENVTVKVIGVEPDTVSPLFRPVAVNEVMVGAAVSKVKLYVLDGVLSLPAGSWMAPAGMEMPTWRSEVGDEPV